MKIFSNGALTAKEKLAASFLSYVLQPDASINQLHVGHLTNLAHINRITFYRNFESLTDFIKWFLLKDLIFKVDTDQTLTFEDTMDRLYDYIVTHRIALQKILASRYREEIMKFIIDESKTYQLLNIQRLDPTNVLSESQRLILRDFFGQGIAQFIFSLIEDERYQAMDRSLFLQNTTRIVKNYIEDMILKIK
jgi:hypothetical protein